MENVNHYLFRFSSFLHNKIIHNNRNNVTKIAENSNFPFYLKNNLNILFILIEIDDTKMKMQISLQNSWLQINAFSNYCLDNALSGALETPSLQISPLLLKGYFRWFRQSNGTLQFSFFGQIQGNIINYPVLYWLVCVRCNFNHILFYKSL